MKVSMVLVDFTVKRWTARKKDQKISDEIADIKQTTKKAGNYRKNLLPFAAPSYEALTSIINAARDFHRENTRPWVDGDLRILPNMNFMHYMESMRKFRQQFEEAVDVFIPDALRPEDGLFAKAKTELNGMWNADDYPNAAKLRAKHDFIVRRFPFPDSDDFRVVDVDLDEIEAMKKETEDAVRQAVQQTTREIWLQLYDALVHVGDVLATDKKVMPGLSDNLVALAELLPRLNLEDDATFTRMASEIREKLNFSPKLVRNSKRDRARLAAEAERIAKQMEQYLK
jgi:hypothetical protein